MLLLLVCLVAATKVAGQDSLGYKSQLRIYVDDDFLNIRGEGTDKGYTGGMQVSFLFTRQHPHSLLNHLLPKASHTALNTYHLDLSYLVFTPSDLSLSYPLQHDYPYAAAMMLDYGLHSYNSQKKYNIQSAITIGAMGPFSGAKNVQQGIHRLIGDEIPEGWNNQLQNDILINLQLGAEKGLVHLGNILDALAGAKLAGGTLIDYGEGYSIVRLGKMNPYFSGIINQRGAPGSTGSRRNKWQLYAFAKPGVQLVAYNALLQGGIILHKPNVYVAEINHVNTYFNYGLVLVYHNFSVSFTQKAFSSLVKGLNSQEPNITISFSW